MTQIDPLTAFTDSHKAAAQRGYRASGLSADELQRLENAIGSKSTLEKFATIGAALADDGVMSLQAANARKQQMFNDPGWRERFFSGDSEARNEMARVVGVLALHEQAKETEHKG